MRDPSEVIAALDREACAWESWNADYSDQPSECCVTSPPLLREAAALIRSLSTPQPASADVVDARRYRVMRDGAVLLSRPPAPGAFPITRLGSVDGKMLHGEELDEMCDAALELVPVVEGRE